jgi:hypothetical protein
VPVHTEGMRGLREELDRFKKTHSDFAVRTINEIDDLFANVEAAGRPGRKQACARRRPSALMVVSHYLET